MASTEVFEHESETETSVDDHGIEQDQLIDDPKPEVISSEPQLSPVKMLRDLFLCLLVYIFVISPPAFISDQISISFGSQLSTRPAPPPQPFLPDSRFVNDFFEGNVYEAFEAAQNHRDAIFMFYAPWDADSIRAKEVFDSVANTFQDFTNLFFGSVNCWSPTGPCAKKFGSRANVQGQQQHQQPQTGSKSSIANQFPIFVFYPKDKRGIPYNGPLTVVALTQFLLNVQKPLEVLESKEDLYQLMALSNGSPLVGYFPNLTASSLSLNYRRFLQASYSVLEVDPLRDHLGPLIAVTSPALAHQLQLNVQQPVRLFQWNTTSISYPNMTISSASALVSWATSKLEPSLTTWIGPSGRKSRATSEHLMQGSGKSLLFFLPRRLTTVLGPELALIKETALEYHQCPTGSSSSSLMIESISSLSKAAVKEQLEAQVQCDPGKWLRAVSDTNDLCLKNSSSSHRPISSYTFDRHSRYSINWQPSPEALRAQTNRQLLKCALMTLTSDHHCFEEEQEGSMAHLGLGCGSNETLNFYLVDSENQEAFAKSLGIQIPEAKPFVVLVDLEQSDVYQLSEPVTKSSLSRFLHAFHHNRQHLTELSLVSDDLGPDSMEINARSFVPKVLNSTRNVVLMYHSTSCGLCASYAYVFHKVKHVLHSFNSNMIDFYTLDSGLNDLPWHFTALSVPSLLFFPSGAEKSDTRAFPADMAVTVENLINFILANLRPEERLQLSMSLCDDSCLTQARANLSNKDQLSEHSKNHMDQLLMREQKRRSQLYSSSKAMDEL